MGRSHENVKSAFFKGVWHVCPVSAISILFVMEILNGKINSTNSYKDFKLEEIDR